MVQPPIEPSYSTSDFIALLGGVLALRESQQPRKHQARHSEAEEQGDEVGTRLRLEDSHCVEEKT